MSSCKRKEFSLPPCGIYVGSGVYPMSKDYLLSVMLGHQAWMQNDFRPLEMIQKIIDDNQGNLAQVWGVPRGYSPRTAAEWFYALDELGIDIPPPDWETGEHVYAVKEPLFERYKERFGAGLLRFMKAAKEKGIFTCFIYTNSRPQWIDRFGEVGKYYLGYDFGERYACSAALAAKSSGKTPDKVNLDDISNDLMSRITAFIAERHADGWGNVMATSGTFLLDHEVEGGTDIPLCEDFPFPNHNFASAYSRGLYRQYNLPAWGSHLAHEHYAWQPNSSPYRMPLLMTAFLQKYMAGSKIIINESGNWFVEATLCEDSPRHRFPAVPLKNEDAPWAGNPKHVIPAFVPYMEEARKLYHTLDYDSAICATYRKVISDFYDFVKAQGTPKGQPESTMAVVKGRHDFCAARFIPTYAVGNNYPRAENDARWFEGEPERGWEIVRRTFFPTHNVTGNYLNPFLSGTPHGQIDIVTFAGSRLDAESLLENYKALAFAGWNSATPKQYETLVEYVKKGGRLFISIPHLSTNVERNYISYTTDELINKGDFSELCGLKVKARGERFYWATAPRESDGPLGFKFPRRFGINYVPRGEIEIVDPEAEILLVDDEESSPLLIRRRLGGGEVLFLNSWSYPGAWDQDFGPGGRVGSSGLISEIYKYLAHASRGYVYITEHMADEPGEECEYIAFSYFPDSGDICLQNVDFDRPHTFDLHVGGECRTISLEGGLFRRICKDGRVAELLTTADMYRIPGERP